jgi:hypothetical protein
MVQKNEDDANKKTAILPIPSTIFIYNPIVDGKRNGCIAIAVKFKESKLAKKALH